jgi:hypothetical protein
MEQSDRFSVSHHSVEDGEKLSGEGNEGELGGFSGVSQLCIEGLEGIGARGRVAAAANQCFLKLTYDGLEREFKVFR